MYNYELMLIYSEKTIPEQQAKLTQKIESIFKKFTLKKDIGFKQLAYQINKNKSGYYFLFHFKADNKMLEEFYRWASVNKNDLIRYLLINIDREPLYKLKDQSNANFEKIAEIQRQYYLKKQQEKERENITNLEENNENILIDKNTTKNKQEIE